MGYLLLQLLSAAPVLLALDAWIFGGLSESNMNTRNIFKGCNDIKDEAIKDDASKNAAKIILYTHFFFMAFRICGGVCMALYKTVRIAVKQAKNENISLKLNRQTFKTLKNVGILTSRTMYGCFRHVLVYLCGAPIYLIIPFSGGKVRTLVNSFIFAIQYSVIFGVIGFTEAPGLTTYLQRILSDHREKLSSQANINITILPDGLKPTFKVFCGLLIVLSWVLFFVTLKWYRDKDKQDFLQNDVDYLDRNISPPKYFDDTEYYTRNLEKESESRIKRNNSSYVQTLDRFDPLNAVEIKKKKLQWREKNKNQFIQNGLKSSLRIESELDEDKEVFSSQTEDTEKYQYNSEFDKKIQKKWLDSCLKPGSKQDKEEEEIPKTPTERQKPQCQVSIELVDRLKAPEGDKHKLNSSRSRSKARQSLRQINTLQRDAVTPSPAGTTPDGRRINRPNLKLELCDRNRTLTLSPSPLQSIQIQECTSPNESVVSPKSRHGTVKKPENVNLIFSSTSNNFDGKARGRSQKTLPSINEGMPEESEEEIHEVENERSNDDARLEASDYLLAIHKVAKI